MKASVFSNKLKTALIVALITALLYLVVYFIAYAMGWGEYAIVIAGVISIMSSVFSYWNSDKMVIKMSGAHEAMGDDLRILQSTVAPLADRAGVPMPKLYVVEDSSPNAFATGRNPSHSAIAATRGLLNMMTPDELSGVLAHEMGHIKNYDILLQTVASVMIGAVIIISDMFSRSLWWGGARRRRDSDSDSGSGILAILGMIFIIIAPIAGQLLRMALSRNREYLADATSASLTGNPRGLASALSKLGANSQPVRNASSATEGMYISDPMKKRNAFSNLFSTHPPIEKRIEALYNMAEENFR